jgi:uncharacterized membrane protein YcjF (UPF0283 family)
MTTLKEKIVAIVNENTGIKATQLVTDVVIQCHNTNEIHPGTENLLQAINELVESGEIVELEFVLPSMEYRVKSIYFPKGTIFPKAVT